MDGRGLVGREGRIESEVETAKGKRYMVRLVDGRGNTGALVGPLSAAHLGVMDEDDGVCPECGSPDPDERRGGDDPGPNGEGTQCQHDWHWR